MILDQNLNEKSSKQLSKRFKITQIIAYDQFSDEFLPLIQQYHTAKSICAYTAITNVRILHELGLDKGLISIQTDDKQRQKYIAEMMNFVLQQRRGYCLKNEELINNKIKAVQYLSDWVANFELSDYLKTLHIPNVYFFRNVAFKYQDLFEQTMFEERERIIKDETPFKDDFYFVYYPFEDKYIPMKQFEISTNHLYIFDTLGHYICGWIKITKKGKALTILETIPYRDSKESEVLLRFFKK